MNVSGLESIHSPDRACVLPPNSLAVSQRGILVAVYSRLWWCVDHLYDSKVASLHSCGTVRWQSTSTFRYPKK